ncbi:hypothetical protein KKH39_01205 [Patescibacteria group bacterium]|nr:hypothetical protein [Patescibacteria group bacterium]
MSFEDSFQENLSEKELNIRKLRAEVEKITDSLGFGIDENIKDSIVAVKAHDFSTSASCEGHLTDKENDRSFLYPSIDIEEPEPEGWRDDEELQRQWSEANALQREKMQKLLDEFYADRDVDEVYKLTINPRGIFNAFVLASAKYKEKYLKPDESEEKVLLRAQAEMQEFTKFLMNKYYD